MRFIAELTQEYGGSRGWRLTLRTRSDSRESTVEQYIDMDQLMTLSIFDLAFDDLKNSLKAEWKASR